MKKLIFLIFICAGCGRAEQDVRQYLSLAGEWGFRIDSLDRGIKERWFLNLPDEKVKLPASMAENGKGDEVTVATKWTGDIVDKSYFTSDKYARYRQEGNIKIPFWLKPIKYYKGPAWYQKEIDLPAGWKGKQVILFLERPHWESTVYVNGHNAGTANSLAVPHQLDISEYLQDGKNIISIRIDNRNVIPIGNNSHSISDHTQSDWNGIAGDISLRATSGIFIQNVSIFPDIKGKKVRARIRISNKSGDAFRGKLVLQAEGLNTPGKGRIKKVTADVRTSSDNLLLNVEYPMGENYELWNEFNPALYRLNVVLKEGLKTVDSMAEDFGMREFRTNGTRFEVSGMPVFLRGTTECCVFPLTGYPPCDTASWGKVLRTIKSYGLNHVRFHSYCPPEAAFEMADRIGIYFHIECSSWANQGSSVGDGTATDRFIYAESDRILSEYGNHPSFCMLAYGNEPAGRNQKKFLGNLITYWKEKDNRRVYTSAAGWPVIDENDYNVTPGPRIQQWGDGLKSIINSRPPQTMFDFRDFVAQYKVPVVSHEIGQWCVYPDFREIDHYTGPLKATNFEIFRESLAEHRMADQSNNFLMASGKLQSLCYKAEIEAALRTPGFAGFEMLQLHDFPGQGTALVGILNPFFESKGYITAEEFRMFCNEVVPLARLEKLVYSNNDTVKADVELFNFSEKVLKNSTLNCILSSSSGDTLSVQKLEKEIIERGNCIQAGKISYNLNELKEPEKLTLTVEIEGTEFRNKWDLWVYPSDQQTDPGRVLITEKLDGPSLKALQNGKSVLLLTYGKVAKGKGADVAIGFSSIFWNTAWTGNQAPHTLGILCNPEHPLFKNFPTEYHSNWQWWDPVSHSQAMVIDGFSEMLRPLIQPIDTWFENRRLALAFETNTNGGKLMVCSIDFSQLQDHQASKQLLASMLKYMNSDQFNPQIQVDVRELRSLLDN